MTVIALLIFVILSFWELKLLFAPDVEWRMPYGDRSLMRLSGLEGLIILMFATAYIGLTPVLSLRLAFLEVLCVIGAFKAVGKLRISWPMWLFVVFIVWEIIGCFYTPSPIFGVRMILKYIYPFLFALFAAKVVSDGEVMLSAGIWARRVATVGIGLMMIPPLKLMMGQFFWFHAAMTTSIITMVIFSFALVEFSDEKKRNFLVGNILLPAMHNIHIPHGHFRDRCGIGLFLCAEIPGERCACRDCLRSVGIMLDVLYPVGEKQDVSPSGRCDNHGLCHGQLR